MARPPAANFDAARTNLIVALDMARQKIANRREERPDKYDDAACDYMAAWYLNRCVDLNVRHFVVIHAISAESYTRWMREVLGIMLHWNQKFETARRAIDLILATLVPAITPSV
jgi:hypothetical protein